MKHRRDLLTKLLIGNYAMYVKRDLYIKYRRDLQVLDENPNFAITRKKLFWNRVLCVWFLCVCCVLASRYVCMCALCVFHHRSVVFEHICFYTQNTHWEAETQHIRRIHTENTQGASRELFCFEILNVVFIFKNWKKIPRSDRLKCCHWA